MRLLRRLICALLFGTLLAACGDETESDPCLKACADLCSPGEPVASCDRCREAC